MAGRVQMNVNPEMVALARKSRGLTQVDLAQRIGISQGLLSRIEGGLREPSNEVLEKIARALRYPTSFFYQDANAYFSGISLLFHRKRQSAPIRILEQIYARIDIIRLHYRKLLEAVEIPEWNAHVVDPAEFDGDIEDIARATRALWGLPPGPIHNLTRAIENAGGLVIPFDFGTNRVDAVSQCPPGMPPLFFVNTAFPGDRLRFTLAHELAHVILHQDDLHPSMEEEADRFAAEFLMPERDIKPYLYKLDLPKLATLKLQWKVSMAALLKRATDLGTIDASQARYLWQRMAKRGYRTREPRELDIPAEQPSLYREIVDAHRKDLGYDDEELGQLIHLYKEEVRELYGARSSEQARARTSSHLRLIK